MFDFLLTVLHFFLLAGLILVALIIRKRSQLILFFVLLPASASALVTLPEPGKGKLLWEGELKQSEVEVIQIPKNPRPYLPVNFFIHQKQGGASFWDQFKNVHLVCDSSKVPGLYPEKRGELVQVGGEWGFIQETFLLEGNYYLKIEGIQIPFVIHPQHYLKFKEEILLFIVGTVILGMVLFGLAYLLRSYDTKR